MKRKLLATALCMLAYTYAIAQAYTVCDFEDYELGQTVTMWNYYGGTPTSKATVVRDPKNSNNKVLRVNLKEWNSYVPFTLPAELSGTKLLQQMNRVSLRLMRATSDVNDNKKFMICQGNVRLYEDDGYPHQGDKGVWQERSYTLPTASDATGNLFALGLHSDASDYYIDDIVLHGRYDDYRTANNDTVNISGQNSSSSYATFATPLLLPEDKQITFLTSRYTYLNSRLAGKGQMHILSGGERTYIGAADKSYPDGSDFEGEVHVFPYKKLSASNGFYGLVWMHGGKTFNVDAALTNMDDSKACNYFQHGTLVMHNGTTLAAESGTHGIRIGHLEMEAGSQLYGYMKSKDANNTYYIVGGNGQDAVLAGRMSPISDNEKMLLGLIKEGCGTYRITGKENNLTGGLRVMQGTVRIDGVTKTSELYVMKDAKAGGSGRLTGDSQIFGTLQPDEEGTNVFTQTGTMTLRPTSRIDCVIRDGKTYSRVVVNGNVNYYNKGQDFTTSDRMPRLRIYLADDAELKEGDSFTLFTLNYRSTGQTTTNDTEWQFDIRYPKSYTWEVTQTKDASGLKVVATVTSLKYSGQGNTGYEDSEDNEDDADLYGTPDLTAEKALNTTLRSYADKAQAYVGTCVPVWSINVDNDNDARTKLIANQFNMVVCENEMKFDNVEPSQNSFNFGDGDRLANFAQRHKMYLRGHTLAWHSQVPGWLTADGNKNTMNRSRQELLAILKNHILKTVGHWKGKVKEWDVVNEVLSDNQTSIYKNPEGYDLRPSVWATGIGEDFIDSAFVWAHQADPQALLILNDYGVEGKGWGKSEALYNLAKRLRKSGIPIDGVGLQCHMDADLTYFAAIDRNIARFEEEGLLCRITELDLGIGSNTNAELELQAETYYRLASIAMSHANCTSLMIWGLTDDLTWRNGRRPLLFDAGNAKKPAYYGVHQALREYSEKKATGIEILKPDAEAARPSQASTTYYDLTGRRISKPTKGIYIAPQTSSKGKRILANP